MPKKALVYFGVPETSSIMCQMPAFSCPSGRTDLFARVGYEGILEACTPGILQPWLVGFRRYWKILDCNCLFLALSANKTTHVHWGAPYAWIRDSMRSMVSRGKHYIMEQLHEWKLQTFVNLFIFNKFGRKFTGFHPELERFWKFRLERFIIRQHLKTITHSYDHRQFFH
jgi:hypothetical protein